MDQNATQAINMAFATIVFVMALSVAMLLFSKVSETADTLAFYSDSTKFYENIELTKICTSCDTYNSLDEKNCTNCKASFPEISADETIARGTERYVSAETIIPTLYRYYKENFCVKFYDMRGASSAPGLIQLFDLTIEGEVRSAASNTGVLTLRDRGLLEAYNKEDKTAYLFQAPWMGNVNKDVKTRVDFFVSGQEGDINNVHVDYTTTRTAGIDNLVEMKDLYDAEPHKYDIVESFVEYNFSGDTITTEDGTETITGDKQAESKIIITYILKDKV